MKVKLEVALEHSVAFVSDPYADHLAPLDIGEKTIAATDHCIAFQVRPYFDGGANITVSSESPFEREPDFKKMLRCDSSVVSISDSAHFNYCMFPVAGKEVEVQIWRNIDQDEGVWIKLFSLTAF